MDWIGAYQVVGQLGAGAMGRVFEVRHPSSPRRLALKLLNPGLPQVSLERFRREAEVLARVRHPSVVAVHELGFDRRGPFLVTDLVEGRSLEEVVRGGEVEPRRAAEIVRTLAEALAAIHAQEILHRDLKPENVILRPDGVPVLLDFGVARDESAESLTRSGQLTGTPAYMSPEQALGERSRQGPWTDVYGLGGVLLALLTGRPPYTGASVVELIARILKSEPTWPSAVRGDVPPELEAICRRAMAKDPGERYQDAAELADDLDAFLHAPPVAQARRRSWQGWVALGVGALLVGALAWSLVGGRQTAEGPRAGEAPLEEPRPAGGPAVPPVGAAGAPPEADPDALLRELQALPAAAFRERIAQAALPQRTRKALRRARDALTELEQSGAREGARGEEVLAAAEAWAAEHARAFPVLVEETAAPLVQGLRLQAELRSPTRYPSLLRWKDGGRVVRVDDGRVIFATQVVVLLGIREKSWTMVSVKAARDVAILGERALSLEGSNLQVRPLTAKDAPLATEPFAEPPLRVAAGAGQRVAVGLASGAIELLELAPTGAVRRLRRLEGHKTPVRALAFTPDGAALVSTAAGGATSEARTHVWDTASGAERARIRHPSAPSCLAVAPDGRSFVVGLQGVDQLRAYPLDGGDEVGWFTLDAAPLDVELSPDGALLYTLSGAPGGPRELCVWDVATREPLRRLRGWAQPVTDLCLVDQGRLLVGVGDGSQVWTWKVGGVPAWPDEVRAGWK